MSQCPKCVSVVPAGSRFCNSCGTPVGTVSMRTETSIPSGATPVGSTDAPATGVGRLSTATPADPRFLPGSLLDERYRIVGLLGKGGMGEVYRADDTKLGQPVALKFLPAALESDPDRMARFVNEVRVARQVSHPNVCRVYDIGEIDGRHYISMEFVDGEDLASLLRRVGRVTGERAVQIARQICAGLAAAHARGVIHRDLKPGNIMIDGRGDARLSDFGLAGLADGFEGAEIRVGTPAYMAPEQLAGKEVTTRSDIYALGLVLYELFTGAAAFKADTVEDLKRKQLDTRPTPASVVPDLDPAVESVVLRCLDSDPEQRPETAMAVLAALPGGDPLAAALDAGETPSPEMVARAGVQGGLRPAWVAVALVLFVAAIVGGRFLSSRAHILGHVALPKGPQVLASEARALTERLGYPEAPVDREYGFFTDSQYMEFVESENDGLDRWSALGSVRPSPIRFWYRESPRPLVPIGLGGGVGTGNPPMALAGMTRMFLDPDGRLTGFLAVPPQFDESVPPENGEKPADWSVLFAAAGLTQVDFESVAPQWNPLVDCDERAAWEGPAPDDPQRTLRVEAGAYRGLPVYLMIAPPWREATRQGPAQISTANQASAIIIMLLILALLLVSGIVARRNLRLGRGDWRGAFRMASTLFVLAMTTWLLTAHHVKSTVSEVAKLGRAAQVALFISAIVWVFYLALEPYVRRMWPHALVSWARLLSGRVRDPLIGRDLVVGGLIGSAIYLLALLAKLGPGWAGRTPPRPLESIAVLHDVGTAFSLLAALPTNALAVSIGLLLLVLLLRLVLRRTWAAVGAAFVLMAGLQMLQSASVGLGFAFSVATWGLILLAMTRFGLLATTFSLFFAYMCLQTPAATDLSVWYSGRVFALLAVTAGLYFYGAYISLGSRSFFEDPLER
ncbi:MAG: protein kinase [bacterium]|nr:protein kinase [bacterium]